MSISLLKKTLFKQIFSCPTFLDPELEELRQTVPKPLDVTPIVEKMIKKSESIHASCLFSPAGAALRRKMCLLLSGTSPSVLHSGWENFAYELNLDGPLIKVDFYNL